MGGKGSGRPEPAPRDIGGRYKGGSGGGCLTVILVVGILVVAGRAAFAYIC